MSLLQELHRLAPLPSVMPGMLWIRHALNIGTDNHSRHIIEDGEDCTRLQAIYGVLFSELRAWNPQINSICSNLLSNTAQVLHRFLIHLFSNRFCQILCQRWSHGCTYHDFSCPDTHIDRYAPWSNAIWYCRKLQSVGVAERRWAQIPLYLWHTG